MNINLSSVSDSPKVAKSVASGEEATSEASESGGFFSKLAAMISGDKPAEGEVEATKKSTNEGDSEAVSDVESESSDVKFASTKSQSTDEILDSESEVKSLDSDKKSAKPEAEASTLTTKNEQVVKPENTESASKIVSENDEVLQRLNESNNALKPKDGKPLPQETDVKPVKGNEGEVAVAASAKSVQQLDGENEQSAPEKPAPQETKVVLNSEGEEVAVPKSVAAFVEKQPTNEASVADAKAQTAKPVDGEAAAVVTTAAAIKGEAVSIQSTETPSEVSPQQVKDQAPLNGEKPVASPNEGEAEVIAAATVGSAAVTQLNPKTATDSKDKTEQAQRVQNSTIQGELSTLEAEAAASVSEPALVAAAAIPWAASGADAPVNDDVVLKGETAPKAQQAALAQSVHQALSHQQAQAAANALQPQAATQSVAAMPTDLSAMQMQNMAAAPNVALAQDQALLKAAMGAKAAGSIGQLVKGSEQTQPGQDSQFAQQLSQAAGIQGTNTLGQARPEQVAAQAPLQLTREMASEQVAERVQMMMSKNLKNIDIRLDPPELGRMQIRMNMNGDGATVHFTVANQQARDVIEQSMPRLREMLAQQGLQLNDSSVQQQSSGQQQKGYANAGQGQNGQGSNTQNGLGEENLEADINLDLNVASKRDGISYYA
ncbi:flagellar hook-length control protein FliK [Vibrio aquaticus]|uniref:Flagellar hook-length control protein FliK n=1 Tax=Vibrio aquaticus TaxID=2496559 RepID=A0A432CY69_9VIBR|nr:flagellar hook-length control protein FliK [Vibrio aquaticus]RTZ15443.1 flagellar hook-length control protein FliK [Vibrio aquaticus]